MFCTVVFKTFPHLLNNCLRYQLRRSFKSDNLYLFLRSCVLGVFQTGSLSSWGSFFDTSYQSNKSCTSFHIILQETIMIVWPHSALITVHKLHLYDAMVRRDGSVDELLLTSETTDCVFGMIFKFQAAKAMTKLNSKAPWLKNIICRIGGKGLDFCRLRFWMLMVFYKRCFSYTLQNFMLKTGDKTE